MKAAHYDRYGPPDVVTLREVDVPVPLEGQVLVRVRASSVNRADLDGLTARYTFARLFTGVRRPRNARLGCDVAGVVEAVGPAVTAFEPGDQVFGDLSAFGLGAFAEYACAPEKAFAAIPDGLSFEEAASLPHSAILALQGLRLRGGRTVKPGDKVMVVGASGNVGPFALQIAKALGAEVVGVARTEKLEFVRSLGADHALDYTRVDYTRTGDRYDWILDVDAHHNVLRWRRALQPDGVYVTQGGPATRMLQAGLLGALVSRAGNRWMGLMFWWKPFDPDDVATLKGLIAAGKLRPAIDSRYPLDQIVEALRRVNDGHASGKVVITV